PTERLAALHDRAGWELFLEQTWHSSGRPQWWRRLVRRRDGSAFRASPTVVPIEVSAPIPSVPEGPNVALFAGGALVVLVDAGRLSAYQGSLRKILTDAAGFELCRVVVREALIGTALGGAPLRDRLAHASARRSAVELWPEEGTRFDTKGNQLAPGARQALGVAASAGVRAVLARHDTGNPGSAASRFADLPTSCEASIRRLADATSIPFLPISGASRGPIAYDPGVSAAPGTAPSRASATPLATPADAPAFGRHHFERLFASGADPWRYESPYERRKYDQTLSLIGNGRFRRSLEAGCAEGHFSVRLAAIVDEVIAADVSEIALARVEARCESQGIRNVVTRRLDLSSDPLPGDFDLVVCSEVLYYMGDRNALADVARRLAAALAPGGVLVMAHAHVLSDSPADTGFDWGLPYGAKTIGETFQAVPGIVLEHEIRTPLYRIQRFRRLADRSTKADEPIIETVPNSVLPEGPTAAGIRWGGSESLMAPPPPVTTSRLPILMYHRIASGAAPGRERYTVHPERFEAQLEYLRDAGFRSATPDEWSGAVAARRPLDGRRIMLTFDDAYEDFGSTAWPLLQRYGFQALLFVVTGHVGKTNAWDSHGRDEPLLDWPALMDLVGEGVPVGSHTVSHPRLTSYAAAEMVEELARSRAELAERLGIAADCVAYPWGGEDAVVHHFAGACGYLTGFTCRSGTASAADAMLALPRLEVSGDLSFGAFVSLFDT
ncbi:MAG TPA: polysaccharide deacetylase family protein, partial [Gemmatimonadaceae bacterium]|nr:polysaccharide deacetylase family protein [Gemmatimonadaceae bacterium]